MKRLMITIPTFVILVVSAFSFKSKGDVVNYLNTSDTLNFNNVTYKLAWSSHPLDNYYKQEYIAEGENAEKYNSMLLIDFLVTQDSTESLVGQKIAEIKERKKLDRFADFQIMQSNAPHEYILDFIMSDINNNAFSTMEWNSYRYRDYTDKQGHRGILLFGYSRRGYGKDIIHFRKDLDANRIHDTYSLALHTFPVIDVK